MSKNNCKRCGRSVLVKMGQYNPYNVTFKNFEFSQDGSMDNGFLCIRCAHWFVKYHNQCKGGVWMLRKDDVKHEI